MNHSMLLIDADSLIYRAGCANETREYVVYACGLPCRSFKYKKDADVFSSANGGEDHGMDVVLEKTAGLLEHSLGNAKQQVEAIMDNFHGHDYRMFIGGVGNFRHDLYDQYKANRDASGKPIHEKAIREYLIDYWGAETVDGEEADDKVSYLQCADIENTCIVGIDKDLWNTPGHHWNFGKSEYSYVTLEEADRNFWLQMLTGDSSDNIPGLPGYGKVKAEKVLTDVPHKDLQSAVVAEYEKNEFDMDYLTLQGRLLWLRREPNQMWRLA